MPQRGVVALFPWLSVGTWAQLSPNGITRMHCFFAGFGGEEMDEAISPFEDRYNPGCGRIRVWDAGLW